MIRYLVVLALTVPAICSAQLTEHQCLIRGNVFYQAATYRDTGMSPQQTFGVMQHSHYEGIDESFLRQAINEIYFDPAFANAGGQPLMVQMAQLCMHPNGIYKPLE